MHPQVFTPDSILDISQALFSSQNNLPQLLMGNLTNFNYYRVISRKPTLLMSNLTNFNYCRVISRKPTLTHAMRPENCKIFCK